MELFLECQSRVSISQSPLEDRLWFFFGGRGRRSTASVTPPRKYRKYHISMYFFRKIIFNFPSNEKISCFFWEKKPFFQIIQEGSYSSAIFFKRPSFWNFWRKYHISMYFSRKISFSVQGKRSYFQEKEISSSPVIQKRSCSSAIFLERTSFQGVRKKKIRFSVQCKIWRNNYDIWMNSFNCPNSFNCLKSLIFLLLFLRAMQCLHFTSNIWLLCFFNELYAIASFILFSRESKIYFAFFKLVWISWESNWCSLFFLFLIFVFILHGDK